jgi:hypothetical protein
MAFNFNFGQALSGFSDVIVEKVKAEEAQALADESWDKRFQKQQDAIDKRTRGQKRRDKEEAAKSMLSELVALGYTVPEAQQAVTGGKGTFNIYRTLGLEGIKKGVTGSSLLNAHDSNIDNAQGTLEGTNSPKIIPNTLAPFSFNPKSVAALYTPLDETDISMDMQLSNNTQEQLKLLNNPDVAGYADKMKVLQEKETFLLGQIGKLADAKREESDTDQPVNVTEYNTLETVIGKNHLKAMRRAGFRVDSETQFMEAFQGKEGRGFSAQLESVDLMERTVSSTGDFAVDRLAEEKKVILKGLKKHAYDEYNKSITRIVDKDGVEAPEQPPALKQFNSVEDHKNAVINGLLKIGEVVIVPNPSGVGVMLSIFTGVPNRELEEEPPIHNILYKGSGY